MTNLSSIACTLTPEELSTRRDALLPGLTARAQHVEISSDGVTLCFAPVPGLVTEIAAVVEAERRCCRFLQFALCVDADDGPIRLHVTAPPEALSVLLDLTCARERPAGDTGTTASATD